MPTLTWKADGALTRLIAELDPEDGERLIIDYDPARPGDCKWFLTWIAPHLTSIPAEGQVLQSHVTAADLKDEAEHFIGEDE